MRRVEKKIKQVRLYIKVTPELMRGDRFALVERIIGLKLWGFCSVLQTVMFGVGVSEFIGTCHSLPQCPVCRLSWAVLAKHKYARGQGLMRCHLSGKQT